MDQLLEIGIKKRNGEISDSWTSLAIQHSNGKFVDGEAYRIWTKNQLRSQGKKPTEENYKESVEIHSDGSHSSNKLLRMSIEEAKDVNYLLRAHGYDTVSWELVSAKSNIWNVKSDQDGISTLYSSKISVKPLKNSFTIEKLVKAMKDIQPVHIDMEPFTVDEKKLLEIPIFDPHFGISDYEYYRRTQARIAISIMSNKWEEILFIVGQDMLHLDNFRGQTANGTPIEKIDLVKAWSDALKFYSPLIEMGIRQSKHVKVMYSKGNHDESMSWAFVQLLKTKYPQATFDDVITERKAHVFYRVFIGVTHGDKARNKLHNLFPVEFPMEWSQAKTRELHIGHLHVEDAKDVFGMMIRTLATRNKTDSWHADNGFVGAHKRFMLFEYSEEELESIHYV